MNSESTLKSPINASARLEPRPLPDTRLVGWRRPLVQGMCAAMVLLTLGIFVISLLANFHFWQMVCTDHLCINGQIGPAGVQALQAIGLSLHFYALYLTTLNTTLATLFSASALVIVLRKRDDWLALFVAVMLVTFGTITFSDTMQGLTTLHPNLWLPAHFIAWFGDVAIMIFFFIFPTGQFVPRWTMLVLFLWAAMEGCRFFLPATPLNLSMSAPALYAILFPIGVVTGIFSQLYRYLRVSGPAQRQQTKWIVFSVVSALGLFVLIALLFHGSQSDE